MLKHRGFPGRMPGSDFQFIIRRAKPDGATPIKARKRHPDRKAVDRAADRLFLAALIEHFGADPFERGNLDAGRLSWLFGREVVAVDPDFNPADYEALLRVDLVVARRSYPELFDSAPDAFDDWDEEGNAEDEDEDEDAGDRGSRA